MSAGTSHSGDDRDDSDYEANVHLSPNDQVADLLESFLSKQKLV
jgi:hypothetical protein